MFPAASTASPDGSSSSAEVAGPPSPLFPDGLRPPLEEVSGDTTELALDRALTALLVTLPVSMLRVSVTDSGPVPAALYAATANVRSSPSLGAAFATAVVPVMVTEWESPVK